VNYIETIRNDIKKDLDENIYQEEDFDTFLSPNGQFRLDAIIFSNKTYWSSYSITKVEIYDNKLNEKLFDFFVNESRFFYGWLTSNNIDFLICAEDIFGGQTVVDLTNKQMTGYSPNEDGFIWADFHLSPDGKILATIGCYWACPAVLKLFDFSNPMNLPLREIQEIELLDNDETILGWLDNETIQMKGVKREREPEYSECGSFKMKIISETKIQRQIKIRG
jgi:hypothetical protein